MRYTPAASGRLDIDGYFGNDDALATAAALSRVG
jgi:hypothetical protein